MTYTVMDLETTTRTSFKRKANPFDPENYVVMSGWKRKGGEVHGEYFGRAGSQGGHGLPADWFTKLLMGTKFLVGANIKFDLLYALQTPVNLAAWMQWVAAGGNVWDIQLAEYLLNGMEPASHMLSLDEMAPNYGGNVKFDEVKALWAAGVSTEDINPDLLRLYLCGNREFIDRGDARYQPEMNPDKGPGYFIGDHGDIGNTELVFLGQLARARACGQVKSIVMNMGSLLCTIEMERNGMAVDVARGLEDAKVLAAEVAEVSIELSKYLPEDLPFAFNWNSSRQKSAIIFGGKVPYDKRVPVLCAEGKQAYAQMDAIVPVTGEDGKPAFYKSGKNAGEAKTKRAKVNDPSKPKSRMETFDYTFPRVTEPKKQWAGAVDGVYSTAAEVIAELANRDIPFLEALGKITSLTKDLTTYYISTDPDTGESKGMLTLVQATGIIHHMLNHTSTVTGRFSSSNPNLQNLPKGGKSNVKGLFVSRFTGGKVIQSDFSSLEVYVQAILTMAKQLIQDLADGLDMHCVRVSQKEGIPYEDALRLCKTPGTPEYKEWDAKRTKAKVFSFQRAYGAGAPKISESAKIPLAEVEALILAEETRYPEVSEFYTELTKDIKESATFSGIRVMHPDIQGLVCYLKKGNWRAPDGKLYAWREQTSPEYLARKNIATSFSPTEIKNYPVQGEGGEWAKAAMWLAVRAYYASGNFGGLALLVNQVHDALYTDADPTVAFEAAALLHACMEEASTFMEWYFDWPLPIGVPSDTTWGTSMLDDDQLPEGFKDRVTHYRTHIRNTYIGGHTPSYETKPLPLAA